MRWINRRFAALFGPEARLGVMRGDVCLCCLWESLDGMIWSACRCDVPLHLSGVRVESTYLSGLPRTEVSARCIQNSGRLCTVALLEDKKSDDISARGWSCWMVASHRVWSLESGPWNLLASTRLDSYWAWTAAHKLGTQTPASEGTR